MPSANELESNQPLKITLLRKIIFEDYLYLWRAAEAYFEVPPHLSHHLNRSLHAVPINILDFTLLSINKTPFGAKHLIPHKPCFILVTLIVGSFITLFSKFGAENGT
jgi:hypothetical protein